jgi:hypothetical protein
MDRGGSLDLQVDPAEAERRKRARLVQINTLVVPRLRVVGFALVATAALLHNALIFPGWSAFVWRDWLWLVGTLAIYSAATWYILYLFYDDARRSIWNDPGDRRRCSGRDPSPGSELMFIRRQKRFDRPAICRSPRAIARALHRCVTAVLADAGLSHRPIAAQSAQPISSTPGNPTRDNRAPADERQSLVGVIRSRAS